VSHSLTVHQETKHSEEERRRKPLCLQLTMRAYHEQLNAGF